MLDVEQIRDVLPHRYPFLLVDRILELVAGSFNYVEIVDESRTSKCIRGYHAEAAIKIARCDGES